MPSVPTGQNHPAKCLHASPPQQSPRVWSIASPAPTGKQHFPLPQRNNDCGSPGSQHLLTTSTPRQAALAWLVSAQDLELDQSGYQDCYW